MTSATSKKPHIISYSISNVDDAGASAGAGAFDSSWKCCEVIFIIFKGHLPKAIDSRIGSFYYEMIGIFFKIFVAHGSYIVLKGSKHSDKFILP